MSLKSLMEKIIFCIVLWISRVNNNNDNNNNNNNNNNDDDDNNNNNNNNNNIHGYGIWSHLIKKFLKENFVL